MSTQRLHLGHTEGDKSLVALDPHAVPDQHAMRGSNRATPSSPNMHLENPSETNPKSAPPTIANPSSHTTSTIPPTLVSPLGSTDPCNTFPYAAQNPPQFKRGWNRASVPSHTHSDVAFCRQSAAEPLVNIANAASHSTVTWLPTSILPRGSTVPCATGPKSSHTGTQRSLGSNCASSPLTTHVVFADLSSGAFAQLESEADS
eukprot:558554-Rhodomonas_salina.2